MQLTRNQVKHFQTKSVTYKGFRLALGVGGGGFSPTFLITVGDMGLSFDLFGVGAGGFISSDRSAVSFFSE